MFPPEIIDHILSFLERDHASLKSCASAHPCLSKLVERHFYLHLTVQNFDPCPAGAYRPSDLLKLCFDKPNIANHVRSLRIHLVGWFWRETESLDSIWSTVTRLQTISLSCLTNVVWDDLCESFRTAFTNCLRVSTLIHVNISNIVGFPLSALDHTSSLQRLSLCGYFYYYSHSSPLAYPPLDCLDLRSCPPISMPIIGTWVESRNFAVCSLKLGKGLEHSSELVGMCAKTLTSLHVDLSVYYSATCYIPIIPFSLSYLPHLAQLTVQIPIHFDLTGRILSCLPATMQFLHTLHSPPTDLVHLIIKIDIRIDNKSNTICDTDWSPLISFPYFDVISRVELRVRARKAGTYLPSVELLKTLKEEDQLMQLEMHHSLLINAMEEPVGSWFDFDSD